MPLVSLIYISWYKSMSGFHWRHASVCPAPNEHRTRWNQCSEVIDWCCRVWGSERGEGRYNGCGCNSVLYRGWLVCRCDLYSTQVGFFVCTARCSFKRLWRCSHSSPSPSIWALQHSPFPFCFFIIFSFDLIPLPFQPIGFMRGGGSVKQMVVLSHDKQHNVGFSKPFVSYINQCKDKPAVH